MLKIFEYAREMIEQEVKEEGRQEGRQEGREEGEIKGKIEIYQELSDKGLLPKELAKQEIAKLKERLEKLNHLEKAA